jgi:hypothetical protein
MTADAFWKNVKIIRSWLSHFYLFIFFLRRGESNVTAKLQFQLLHVPRSVSMSSNAAGHKNFGTTMSWYLTIDTFFIHSHRFTIVTSKKNKGHQLFYFNRTEKTPDSSNPVFYWIHIAYVRVPRVVIAVQDTTIGTTIII